LRSSRAGEHVEELLARVGVDQVDKYAMQLIASCGGTAMTPDPRAPEIAFASRRCNKTGHNQQ
jgi:hypothetical protein